MSQVRAGIKVDYFEAGDRGPRAGWYYRVDEDGRKGEWFGTYDTEDEARAEARWESKSSDCDCDDD